MLAVLMVCTLLMGAVSGQMNIPSNLFGGGEPTTSSTTSITTEAVTTTAETTTTTSEATTTTTEPTTTITEADTTTTELTTITTEPITTTIDSTTDESNPTTSDQTTSRSTSMIPESSAAESMTERTETIDDDTITTDIAQSTVESVTDENTEFTPVATEQRLKTLQTVLEELNSSNSMTAKEAKIFLDDISRFSGKIYNIVDLVDITLALLTMARLNPMKNANIFQVTSLTQNTTAAGPNLLYAVETFTGNVAIRLMNADDIKTLTVKSRAVDIHIDKAENSTADINYSDGGGTQFRIARTLLPDDEYAVTAVMFRGLEIVFPVIVENPNITNFAIGSKILSATLYRRDLATPIPLYNIPGLIQLIFKMDQQKVPTNLKHHCSFWNYDAGLSNKRDNDMGAWSNEGCETLDFPSIGDSKNDDKLQTSVGCECNHLTSFAVLMQLVEIKLSATDKAALEMITYIGCSLSILGAILTILTFVLLRLFTDRIMIHINLALAIIFSQTILLLESTIPRGTSACVAVTVMLFYFNMAIFCWMLVEGIQIFQQVVVVFVSDSKMKVYYGLGWGIPAMIVSVACGLINKNLGQHGVCWLSPRDGSIWAFAIPALTVCVINLVILGRVLQVISKLSSSMTGDHVTKLTHLKNTVKASVLLLPILGSTWLFGVLAFSSHTVVFQYIFATVNSLQGLFIFFFHCIGSSEVREVFMRRKSTWEWSRGLTVPSGKVEPIDGSGTRSSSVQTPQIITAPQMTKPPPLY
ncbi:unnamed protein product [Owenia fusiformis]|uniref:Adhesion G-protein coupled receptor D1-like n=1 Tax=Owenia fusiformis TaxID=6347 RepID=A0A8J1TDL2_OWEFU|nr:unnamed protein product [Owenia fusiformis]